MHNRTLLALYIILLSTLFISCNNDSDDKKETTTTNNWIEVNMRHWYYWYDEIPKNNNLNFSATPEAFFNSLLSSKDGKKNSKGEHYYYSSINKKPVLTRSNNSDLSYGFEFQSWLLGEGTSNYAVNVLYVLPNSPAAKAGLKRGDWVFKINGSSVTKTNIYDLIGTKELKISVSDNYKDQNSNLRVMTLTPQVIEDNPVFYSNVYQDESTGGAKVGYLVYNHFTSGVDDEDTTYDLSLKKAFGDFKSQGVEELVLDLRYNGGGVITSAQLLAELLAPESAVGKLFCETRYNSNVNKTKPYLLNKVDENINLSRLYILTSKRTASASEAIINGLRPYYNVYLLGEQTEGKNVGSVTFTDDKYDYELHPIVCQIFNAKGQSNYAKGFAPDWLWEKNAGLIDGHIELGDKDNDVLLKNALQMMTKGAVTTRSSAESSINAAPQYSSLDYKNNQRLIVPAQ